MKLNRPLQRQVNVKGWRSEDRRYKFRATPTAKEPMGRRRC